VHFLVDFRRVIHSFKYKEHSYSLSPLVRVAFAKI